MAASLLVLCLAEGIHSYGLRLLRRAGSQALRLDQKRWPERQSDAAGGVVTRKNEDIIPGTLSAQEPVRRAHLVPGHRDDIPDTSLQHQYMLEV